MSASGVVWSPDVCGVCRVLGTCQVRSSSLNHRSLQADRECRESISVDHDSEGRVESTKCLLVVEDGILKPGLHEPLAQVKKWET